MFHDVLERTSNNAGISSVTHTGSEGDTRR